jgi:hypothetical protein
MRQGQGQIKLLIQPAIGRGVSPRWRALPWAILLGVALMLALPAAASASGWEHAGFLFDEFDLTLAPGHRKEAAGPFYYSEVQEGRHTWALPPFYSHSWDPETDSEEIDIAYPLVTYDRFGDQYRWHIGQLFSFAGGPSQLENDRRRFTLFPVYFRQWSSLPEENYTAVLPFYGRLKHRLFRDEIYFVMFPFYIQSRKADVVTDNYVYPFVHVRHGDALRGWQVWPFIGREHKDVTTLTNGFGEVQTVGGYDKSFIMWPFYFEQKTGIGTDNPQWVQGSLPAYSLLRSPLRDSTTVLWPLFSRIDDREKKYREWELPWPLVVVARGPGKTITRVFPFYSRAHSAYLESDFYIWPIYKYNRFHADPADRSRTRILFFLYSDVRDMNTETGSWRHRVDFLPFYTFQRDFKGNRRLQILAPLEPFVPNNKSIDRDYAQLWSLWRSETNPKTKAASQSLLWNLYRHESTPTRQRTSLLFGLYQMERDDKGKHVRLFYTTLRK